MICSQSPLFQIFWNIFYFSETLFILWKISSPKKVSHSSVLSVIESFISNKAFCPQQLYKNSSPHCPRLLHPSSLPSFKIQSSEALKNSLCPQRFAFHIHPSRETRCAHTYRYTYLCPTKRRTSGRCVARINRMRGRRCGCAPIYIYSDASRSRRLSRTSAALHRRRRPRVV